MSEIALIVLASAEAHQLHEETHRRGMVMLSGTMEICGPLCIGRHLEEHLATALRVALEDQERPPASPENARPTARAQDDPARLNR